MRVLQQQQGQGQVQSSLSQEQINSSASYHEAQQGHLSLGPSMRHPSRSSHVSEPAGQYEQEVPAVSDRPQTNTPPLGPGLLDETPYRGRRQRFSRLICDYLQLVWLDFLFIFLNYAICGALFYWAPMYRPRYRMIPLWYDPVKKEWYGPLSISCPKNNWPDVITSTQTGMVVVFVPLAVILFVQLFTKSFWDAHHAKFGLVKALAVMTLFQEIFKRFVGEPRPYFMNHCNLNVPPNTIGSPYKPTWFKIREVCPDIEDNAWQSFPSGHTGSSFAAGTFLALYLNAKLKAFSNYHTNYWKQMCVLAPLLGAGLVSIGMIIDCNHHAHDVILSMLIGIICGLFAYRAHYHSMFDYRNNHIPLPYHGQTNNFKPIDSSLNAASSQAEEAKVDEKTAYGPNSPYPDKHLAVRWPFGIDEKRGARSTKKQIPDPGPNSTPTRTPIDAGSDSGRMAMDGNSSVNGVVSTRIRTSTEQGSVIHHMPTGNDGASSFRRSHRGDDEASIRDRELIGSGVGSEVADMV